MAKEGTIAATLVQMGFAADTGLAKDTVVNTFAFATLTQTPVVGAQLQTVVEAFYDTVAPTVAPSSFLSSLLTGFYTLRAYDLSLPEPRFPYFVGTGSVGPIATDAMASEVCACLSFQGVKISGTPQARRRGRIYFGPVSETATAGSTTSRPSTTLLTALRLNAQQLVAQSAAINAPWSVYSRANSGPASPALTTITDGWTDNAWDTQRRRGLSPTVRTLWPA